MNRDFHSIYHSLINEYIDLKHSLGFKFKGGEYILSLIDNFFVEQEVTSLGITKELSDEWCKRRDNDGDGYHHKCCIFISFASFLNIKGIRSYIAMPPRMKVSFVPHIFTTDEIERIFNACDAIQNKNKEMRSPIFMIPALIRTLYSTGIRVGEALSLLNKDVNLADKYFILRETKNGKERLIPFSDTLSEVLNTYVSYRERLPIETSENTPFFINLRGQKCSRAVILKKFNRILISIGIPKGKIRVHDLRHTFAVHSLAKMAEEGIDLYCMLPVLSAYLGHQSFQATNNYVRLTAQMYPELIRDVDTISYDLFPKI